MSLSATSIRFLNTSRDVDFTMSPGSLFQCLTTLFMKKFFLTSNPNLSWSNLKPLHHVLSFVTWKKRPTPFLLQPPCRYLETAIRSPLQPRLLQIKQLQFPQSLLITHFLVLLPALLLFFAHDWATQFPFHIEGPKAEHNIWGAIYNNIIII